MNRFIGENRLDYTLWAHYLSYGAAMMCLCMGIFVVVWTNDSVYDCKIDGNKINSIYILNPSTNSCSAVYDGKPICCDSNSDSDLNGYLWIGLFYIFYSILIVLYEGIIIIIILIIM